MIVASDAMWSGKGIDSWDLPPEEYVGHQRTAGTRGKTLRAARENGVPLMFTIAQMAYWPAYHLGLTGIEGMQKRGRLQKGMVADITIFDPVNVTDNATYKAGKQGLPTTGIPYVIVSGVPVVSENKFQLDVRPGKSIRFPVEPKGRFKPITLEDWDRHHAIAGFTIDAGALGQPDSGADSNRTQTNSFKESGPTAGKACDRPGPSYCNRDDRIRTHDCSTSIRLGRYRGVGVWMRNQVWIGHQRTTLMTTICLNCLNVRARVLAFLLILTHLMRAN